MNRNPQQNEAPEGSREALLGRLRQRSRMTFAEYMDIVLYDPDHGYYRRGRSPIGPRGDFFTSVSATRLFGRILASALQEWRERIGEPFTVYEFGAHHGQLTQDLEAHLPGVKIQPLDVGDPLPERMRGCVLSNELLDAMPFHRVKVVNGEWQEQWVTVTGTEPLRFGWQLGPLSTPDLARELSPLPRQVMEGYETEVSLNAQRWIRQVEESLEAGVVLSVDYGHDTLDYYAPRRVQGGLRCYRNHQMSADPFAYPGEQDITCDVNFGSLIDVAQDAGLELVEFTDQARYLLRVGAKVIRDIAERDAGEFSRDRNAIHLLTHPQFMGGPFKVLVLQKHVS